MLWCKTSRPDIEEARKFAEAILREYPDKLLAYNCSPSFNWKKNLSDGDIAKFQRELGSLGYKFQFVTLAGFHTLNFSMFDLAKDYAGEGMSAYVRLQEKEFKAKERGYTAVEHQSEVGASYFDEVNEVVSGGSTATGAMKDSTEKEQF